MSTAVTTLTAGSSAAFTIPILLALVITGVVLCTYIGHRWSTLIVGILIGLYLSGDFAEGAKTFVSKTVIAIVSGISSVVG